MRFPLEMTNGVSSRYQRRITKVIETTPHEAAAPNCTAAHIKELSARCGG